MGTCGSKCCFESPIPSISDPESPHEKIVISSDSISLTTPPPPPKDPFSDSPKNHSKFQIHPCSPIPSNSSSNSISTSTITTSNATTSYSSSYSTDNYSSDYSRPNHSDSTHWPPKKKSFSNEFLLSCVENSNIVILDPIKGIKEKPVESELVITPSQYLSVTSTTRGTGTISSLRQRSNTNTSMRANQSNNANKRVRSVSPASRTGRKVIKPDPVSWNPVSSNFTRPRTADHQSPPQWRPVNLQRGSLNALTGPVSRPVSANKRDLKRPTMEKEVKERLIDNGEVVSIERAKTQPLLVEDLNNPLIAMDCFIFL